MADVSIQRLSHQFYSYAHHVDAACNAKQEEKSAKYLAHHRRRWRCMRYINKAEIAQLSPCQAFYGFANIYVRTAE